VNRLMNRLKAVGAFAYDFVVGDDWRVAALVVAGLALTEIATRAAKVNAWWLLPVFVLAALAWSLHRATAKRTGQPRKKLTQEKINDTEF
jgi:hypothetical protein